MTPKEAVDAHIEGIDTSDRDFLIHRYATPGGRYCRVGDVAFCGHVKATQVFPSSAAADASGYPPCVCCNELALAAGGWT